MEKNTASIIIKAKSLGLAIVLTILFGGLGLLYASITGGIIMLIVELITLFIAVVTLGFGGVLFVPVHIVSVIWAVISINRYNSKLIENA